MPDRISTPSPPTSDVWIPSTPRFIADALAAACAYFGVVLTVVSLLAPVREFFVRTGTDPLLAGMAEAPVIALAMTYGAGWSARIFNVPATLRARLIVGGVGMGLLCAFGGVALLLGGASPSDIWSELASGPGIVAVLTVCLGVILPLARGRR
jgi:hypothetical protein